MFAENMATSNFNNWKLTRPNKFGEWNNALKNRIQMSVRYTGPNEGEAPILTLADDVSSWEIGDKIVVAATNFDPRESETFFITSTSSLISGAIARRCYSVRSIL